MTVSPTFEHNRTDPHFAHPGADIISATGRDLFRGDVGPSVFFFLNQQKTVKQSNQNRKEEGFAGDAK